MNLLAVTNFPSPRYPTAVVWFRDTLCRIRDLGHRVTVLSQRIWVPWPLGYVPRYAQYLKEVYYEEQNGLPVYRPVYPRPPGAWFVAYEGSLMATASRRLVRRLHRERPFDAIIGYSIFPYGHCAVRLGRMLGCAVACVSIGSDLHVTAQFSDRHRRLVRRIFDGSARVLTNCKDLGQVAVELGAQPDRVRPYYEGINVAPYESPPTKAQARSRLGLPNTEKLVVFIARLHRPKGAFELLEAFAMTAPGHPEWRLLMIGDPISRDELQSLARQRAIDDRVSWPGLVPHTQIPSYLAAADLYVLPSYHEGLSFGLQEAMAAGLPVVTTPVGGHPEVVHDGVNGRLVPPRDANALAKVLGELMDDQEQAARLGRAAREDVFEHYNTHRNAAKLAGIIEEMCEK